MQVLSDPVTVNREQNLMNAIGALHREGQISVLICKPGDLLNTRMEASVESTSFLRIYFRL